MLGITSSRSAKVPGASVGGAPGADHFRLNGFVMAKKIPNHGKMAKLSFGRYLGICVNQVPSGYLRWLINEDVYLPDATRCDVLEVLSNRMLQRKKPLKNRPSG